jgi:hypothetical protein
MLLLSWWVVDQYHVEEQLGLVRIFPFVVVGFIIHSSLPLSLRQPFFILTTIGAAVYLFGIWNALTLVGLVLGFLLMAHLVISFRWKVMVVSLSGILLALMKAGILYDLRNEREEVSWVRRLGYFFMLPNLIFPIFPIVDYKIYKATYYNAEPSEIYYRGVTMVMRGLIHLLVYRVIYLYLVPGIDEVNTLMDLVQYLTMSYLTIMRLSGMFHIALGMLLLFGFNLPEIFNNYFLASGFSDYWRRINIYWKDFMLKIFYYPFYFKVKHWNALLSLVVTTVFVFVLTWLLHVYQWFWVLGYADIRATDIAFWCIFGVLVTISAVIQAKKRSPRADPKKWTSSLKKGFEIAATFCTAAIMWSIWVSPTFESWFGVLAINDVTNLDAWIQFTLMILMSSLFISLSYFIYHNHIKESKFESVVLNLNTVILAIILASFGLGCTSTGKAYIEDRFNFSMDSFSKMRLNQADQSTQFENYYDEILTANNLTSPLWQQEADNEDIDRLHKTELVEPTGDMLFHRLKPNQSMMFKGVEITTNSHGMRDKEYSVQPEIGIKRMAVVGGSIEMGSGVADDEVFEQILERRLNLSEEGTDSVQYEILNFSHSSRNLVQHLYNFEKHIVAFKPNMVLLFNHDREWNAMSNMFVKIVKEVGGIDRIPYPGLQQIVEDIRSEGPLTKEAVLREMIPRLEEIYAECYRSIAYICKEEGIVPIWVHLPGLVREGSIKISDGEVAEIAREAGFETINLKDVFDGKKLEDLQVSRKDIHPNAEGHALIAKALHEELKKILK